MNVEINHKLNIYYLSYNISVLILGVHDPNLLPGGLQDPGDGEGLLQRHEAALRGPALQTPPHVLGLDTWHVTRVSRYGDCPPRVRSLRC